MHTAGGEPGDRAAEEPNAGHRPFVIEDFDVRDAAGVVDRNMTELPAHSVVAVVAPTRHAMPRNPELAEFLDIDMDEFARVAPAVTVRRLWWLKARPSLQPLALPCNLMGLLGLRVGSAPPSLKETQLTNVDGIYS